VVHHDLNSVVTSEQHSVEYKEGGRAEENYRPKWSQVIYIASTTHLPTTNLRKKEEERKEGVGG
jgi:hypothetical protein